MSKNVPAADIIVTPLADAEKASDGIREDLEAAYNSIAGAAALTEAVPTLEQALEERKADVKADDLVVRDLVNVTLTQEYAEDLALTGHNITLNFKLGMNPGDFLMVMCFVDGQWVILDADQVEILEDGTVNVTFREQIGTIAFVVERSGD